MPFLPAPVRYCSTLLPRHSTPAVFFSFQDILRRLPSSIALENDGRAFNDELELANFCDAEVRTVVVNYALAEEERKTCGPRPQLAGSCRSVEACGVFRSRLVGNAHGLLVGFCQAELLRVASPVRVEKLVLRPPPRTPPESSFAPVSSNLRAVSCLYGVGDVNH